jgi:hypothetical protein
MNTCTGHANYDLTARSAHRVARVTAAVPASRGSPSGRGRAGPGCRPHGRIREQRGGHADAAARNGGAS